MSEQPAQATDAKMLQILITEHNNLQAARSATVFEANGRTTLFLGAVSSSLVALAFIGQISEMGNVFYIFALILIPSLIFIGLVTFVRVNQTGIEDMMAARNINRIRHYYIDIAPDAKSYFMLSTHDDMIGYVQNLGGHASMFQQFVSTPGLVSVINSILTGSFVGLVIFSLFNAALLVCIAVSVATFIISVGLYMRYQHQYWEKNESRLTVLLPSEQEG
jgi:hypothetical protein